MIHPKYTHKKLAFIGGGQMASALAGGLLSAGWSSDELVVVEPNEAQRIKLQSSMGMRALSEPDKILADVEIVVWAVKPQVLEQAIGQAAPFLGQPPHISIAAGVRSEDIAAWTASRRVVRVMPNTAALVGSGVSAIAALDGVGTEDRALVESIFSTTGYCFWVDTDDRLDAATAVSGSGPGYVFHFMEAFQSAAEALGFSTDEARNLVVRIVAGAVEQAKRDDTPFATLRQNVTSKRGTTEAALAVLDERNAAEALCAAVAAAHTRAAELSQEYGRGSKV